MMQRNRNSGDGYELTLRELPAFLLKGHGVWPFGATFSCLSSSALNNSTP